MTRTWGWSAAVAAVVAVSVAGCNRQRDAALDRDELVRLVRQELGGGVAGEAAGPVAAAAQPEGWGNLTMTFVYDGDPPPRAAVNITADHQFCGQHGLLDESLIVDRQSGGIKNVVIYLAPDRGAVVPVHDDYQATADAEVLLDNHDCRFEPRVALLRTTQTLVVANSDPVGHNTNASLLSNPNFNISVPANSRVTRSLSREERVPMPVACNIHPWMSAYVLVRDTPYMAVSDETGRIELENLPAGQWSFQVWHESAGNVTAVQRNGEAETWARGQVSISIEPGETNDFGTIRIGSGVLR